MNCNDSFLFVILHGTEQTSVSGNLLNIPNEKFMEMRSSVK